MSRGMALLYANAQIALHTQEMTSSAAARAPLTSMNETREAGMCATRHPGAPCTPSGARAARCPHGR